jgi:hypothetical protein
MTTKTTILLGAAAGAMMLLGAGGAWADNPCGLNDNQLNLGFTCEVTESEETRTRTIGSGPGTQCQTQTRTVTTWTAYNLVGKEMEDKGGSSATEWEGSGQPAPGACP